MLGNEQMIRILIDNNANVTAKDNTGATPFDLAVQQSISIKLMRNIFILMHSNGFNCRLHNYC